MVTLAAPAPDQPGMDSLEEISKWLGTYRERLQLARRNESLQASVVVSRLRGHPRDRRAELA